jgi:hypothetical protein
MLDVRGSIYRPGGQRWRQTHVRYDGIRQCRCCARAAGRSQFAVHYVHYWPLLARPKTAVRSSASSKQQGRRPLFCVTPQMPGLGVGRLVPPRPAAEAFIPAIFTYTWLMAGAARAESRSAARSRACFAPYWLLLPAGYLFWGPSQNRRPVRSSRHFLIERKHSNQRRERPGCVAYLLTRARRAAALGRVVVAIAAATLIASCTQRVNWALNSADYS